MCRGAGGGGRMAVRAEGCVPCHVFAHLQGPELLAGVPGDEALDGHLPRSLRPGRHPCRGRARGGGGAGVPRCRRRRRSRGLRQDPAALRGGGRAGGWPPAQGCGCGLGRTLRDVAGQGPGGSGVGLGGEVDGVAPRRHGPDGVPVGTKRLASQPGRGDSDGTGANQCMVARHVHSRISLTCACVPAWPRRVP